MDPVVQERMFCLLSAPAPRKNNSGGMLTRVRCRVVYPFFHVFSIIMVQWKVLHPKMKGNDTPGN